MIRKMSVSGLVLLLVIALMVGMPVFAIPKYKYESFKFKFEEYHKYKIAKYENEHTTYLSNKQILDYLEGTKRELITGETVERMLSHLPLFIRKQSVGPRKIIKYSMRVYRYTKNVLPREIRQNAKGLLKKFKKYQYPIYGVIVVIFVISQSYESLSITPFMFGATISIDNDIGNDDYNGLSRTDDGGGVGPWATLHNIETYGSSPGDVFEVKRGTTVPGEVALIFAHSGTSGNRVVYTAYGAGAIPIVGFAGSGYMQINGDYWTMEYWEINDTSGRGIVCNDQYNPHHDFTLQECRFIDTGRQGIILEKFNYFYDVLITDNYFNNCGQAAGGGAIALTGTGTVIKPYDIEVSYNTMVDNHGDSFTMHEGDSLPDNTIGAGCKIHDNYVEGGLSDSYDLTTGVDAKFYNNEATTGAIMEVMTDHSWNGEIYRNYIHGSLNTNGHLSIITPNVTAWGNLIIGNNRGSTLFNIIDSNANGFDVTDIKVIKNTFIWNGETYNVRFSNHGHFANMEFSSNIVSYITGSGPTYLVYFSTDDASVSGFTMDNNVWGPDTFSCYDNGNVRNWAYWTGTLGYDAHGVNADPLFINRVGGDYHLDTGSPALTLGPTTGTYHPDLDGVNSQNDAGCYDFASPPPPNRIEFHNVSLTNVVIEN